MPECSRAGLGTILAEVVVGNRRCRDNKRLAEGSIIEGSLVLDDDDGEFGVNVAGNSDRLVIRINEDDDRRIDWQWFHKSVVWSVRQGHKADNRTEKQHEDEEAEGDASPFMAG